MSRKRAKFSTFEMKRIYIALIVIALAIAVMIALAFFYLDRERHQTFLYALYRNNVLIGYEKLDRYLLENRVIYKSSTELPRDIFKDQIIRKISFDSRGKNLSDYTKDTLTDGTTSTVYLLKDKKKVSFLASGHAKFSYLDSVPTYGNELVFERESIVTYPSLIKRYNFKKRGEQFANVIRPVYTFLPPIRDIVSMAYIGKDAIEIEGKKVNCEYLILKLGSGEHVSVWATRSFHNILMVEVPRSGFKAVLCAKKRGIPVKEYAKSSKLYVEKEVTFINEEIMLRGTLSIPDIGKAPYPAVMLIWNSGPMDRDALGIFKDISHALAESGYCVLRFDKRGVGQSQGSFSAYAQPEEISDLKFALNFLKSQPEVDKSRIAVLGHSEGGFYATHLAGADEKIRACIIMSPLSSLTPLKNDCRKLREYIEKAVPGDYEYLKSAIAAISENRSMIKDKSDWITILRKRVFAKKMALEDKYSPVDTIRKVKVPTLILHGRKNNINLAEEAEELGKALAEAGNSNFTTIYFGELGHFFGTMVKDPPVADHIELDGEVLKSITTWLDKNLAPLLPAAPVASGGGTAETPESSNVKASESQSLPLEQNALP